MYQITDNIAAVKQLKITTPQKTASVSGAKIVSTSTPITKPPQPAMIAAPNLYSFMQIHPTSMPIITESTTTVQFKIFYPVVSTDGFKKVAYDSNSSPIEVTINPTKKQTTGKNFLPNKAK